MQTHLRWSKHLMDFWTKNKIVWRNKRNKEHGTLIWNRWLYHAFYVHFCSEEELSAKLFVYYKRHGAFTLLPCFLQAKPKMGGAKKLCSVLLMIWRMSIPASKVFLFAICSAWCSSTMSIIRNSPCVKWVHLQLRVCQNDASSFFYKQNPDFHKPGLCHVQKNLYL